MDYLLKGGRAGVMATTRRENMELALANLGRQLTEMGYTVSAQQLADMATHILTTEDTARAADGVYVATNADGDTVLACGASGCQWQHWLPAPFLLGDAARLAAVHKQECASEWHG